MHFDAYPGVSFHNVAELEPATWADGGRRLARLPSDVYAKLNVGARERVRHPTGCEIRFVPERDDAVVAVTLSAPSETAVYPFWGPFQPPDPRQIGPGPTTLEFAVPDRVRALEPEVAAQSAFDPFVCRLRFDAWTPVAVHDVTGACRPPTADQLPDNRYLAYGTSITEGADCSAPHLSYVARAARLLGVDPLTLGTSGSAFCEPAMADYIASRTDWDVATLAVSVNMANRGFTVAQFRERVESLVSRIATAHPTRPIVCVTLFPYHADVVRGDEPDRASAFRGAVRDVVADAPRTVRLVSGPDLLEPTGLSTDLLHPGDHGMARIGRGLAAELAGVLE
ncbi:GDSL-type esterase/lipase family protein [Natrarchaeobius sp. A-rgal3]|uniref:GDSL-type esterase/lipase family protein n=1 Tax=Natrarchaeobius versutus TaxID=1679078 RepID=UPI003510558D